MISTIISRLRRYPRWAAFVMPPISLVITPDLNELHCQPCLKRNYKFRLAWGKTSSIFNPFSIEPGWAAFVMPPTSRVITPDMNEFHCQTCLKRNCKYRLASYKTSSIFNLFSLELP
jgi:hypothetical protein